MDLSIPMWFAIAALAVAAFIGGHGVIVGFIEWQERRVKEKRLELLRRKNNDTTPVTSTKEKNESNT